MSSVLPWSGCLALGGIALRLLVRTVEMLYIKTNDYLVLHIYLNEYVKGCQNALTELLNQFPFCALAFCERPCAGHSLESRLVQ